MNFRHHNGTLLGFAALVCVGAGSGPVMAQQNIDLSSSFYSEGRYESNFLRLSDGEKAANPGLQAEDYILSVGGNLRVAIPLGRQRLYADVSASYDFHDRNTRFDRDSLGAAAGLDWKLGARCSGLAAYQFKRELNDFETISDLTKNMQNTSSINGDAQCIITGRLALAAGADALWLDNSETDRRALDRTEKGVNGGLRFLIGPSKMIGVTFEYRERRFPGRLASGGLNVESSVQKSAGLDFEWGLGARLRFSGRFGYTDVQDDLDTTASFEGITGRIEMEYKSSDRFVASLRLAREISNPGSLAIPFAREDVAGIDLGFQPTRRIGFSLSADYRRRSFKDSGQAFQLLGQSQTDNRYGVGAKMSYKFLRSLALEVGASYDQRGTDIEAFEYSSVRVTVGLQLDLG